MLVFGVGLQVGRLQWCEDVGGELLQCGYLIDGAGCGIWECVVSENEQSVGA